MSRIVIALGGNALGNTPYEQLELVTETAKPIVDLIEAGNEVIIAHGNGPQVGMINLAMSAAAEAGAVKSDMPFPECGAMSQGYIGYHLQNAIGNELVKRGINKPVATIVTQVLVDENDGAFQKPTKPIGAFYTKEQADEIAATKGFTMVEDAGRGYRRVVPSPKPVDVVEKDVVEAVVNSGAVVITVGGGGIPVIKKDGKLIIILDFEKIVSDINPETGLKVSEINELGARKRSNVPILIAEDSPLLNKLIVDSLKKAG